MAEEISNPLLSLVREQGLVDDLQYEEVVGEIKRSGSSVFQLLQDFGIMDADAILQAMANHLGTEVVSLKDFQIPAAVLGAIPSNTAKMYRCVPVELDGGTLRVAFEDPLDQQRVDELGFVAKKDIQLVVAHPAEIQALLDKNYGEEGSEDIAGILKELGGDEKIAEESAAAAQDMATQARDLNGSVSDLLALVGRAGDQVAAGR